MNVRLVAYRDATTTSTSESTYQLDLQESPSISLNFQFADIKEPETRKGSYSQTFKLPFTDNNNEFFQNWFNVNLDTLVFSTRKKFDAVLYVGTVPQMEGFIQLKSVYKKAQVYEVVLMANTASLFSTIGEQRLKDAFLDSNGSYNDEFNHVFNESNLAASWSNSLQNTAGASLYDSGASVSKIVYPISVIDPNFYFNPNEVDATGSATKKFLRLDSSAISSINDSDISSELSVRMSQFRPAIQLKSLIKLIIARAGFSYTSTFIDGSYFGKLFMTTCGHLGMGVTPTANSNANPSGVMDVGNNAEWGIVTTTSTSSQSSQHIVPANTVTPTTNNTAPIDADNIWNETYNYFTRSDVNMTQVSVRHIMSASNIAPATGSVITFQAILRPFDTTTNTPNLDFNYAESPVWEATTTGSNTLNWGWMVWQLDLSAMPTGASAQIVILVDNYKSSGGTMTLTLGKFTADAALIFPVGNDLYSNIRIDWVGYSNDIYGATVDIPSCIDPEITQKAFLKDIIERFNLLVVTDPDDAGNLIIEPYNDYLAAGDVKYWTDKIDTSKEIIVKDTTTIQKKTIHFTDQEDVDMYNKEFKEKFPNLNVYGHLKIDDFGNDFATGELKNNSIFSPFINSQVFVNEDTQGGTYLPNFSPQYEFSYTEQDGQFKNEIKETKPKLFFYNGSPTTVLGVTGSSTSYNLHRVFSNSGTVTVTAYNFTTYPVCSPFDITPSSNVYSLTEANKSLYWNSSPPVVGNLSVFNYNNGTGSWFNNSLYGLYWQQYINDIYNSEARIMECYLNLDEVDILNFKFNDEIFIKDTYWRVLNISNYQVGAKASTKVTLLKVVDTLVQCEGCDYVLGEINNNNLYANTLYLWCPEDTPGCTPDISSGDVLGIYANPNCCTCNGGQVLWNATNQAANGLYPCIANAGSLPIRIQSIFSNTSIFSSVQTKSLIYNKFGGSNRPLVIGDNNTKYSKALIPLHGDDMVIKYKTKNRDIPQLEGESHKIVLIGNTSGRARGYAYAQGDLYAKPVSIPNNSNMIIRVKGLATVVGGTNTTYPLGYTEGFAYYTVFQNINGTIRQIGTAGGTFDFNVRDTGSATCTLYITGSSGSVQFGLDDTELDTKRIWQLSADIDVNRLNNMSLGYDENWALYQNGQNIELQNGDYLLWN